MTTTKKTGRKLCTKADEAAVRKAVAEALGRGEADVNLYFEDTATPPMLDCIEVWLQARHAPRGLSAKELDNLAAIADLHPTRQGWAWAVEETGDAEAFKRDLTKQVLDAQPGKGGGAGGSVRITAQRIEGVTISANGGPSAAPQPAPAAPLPMRQIGQPFEVWSESPTPERGSRFVIDGDRLAFEKFVRRDALGSPIWAARSLEEMDASDCKGLVNALRAAGTMAEREVQQRALFEPPMDSSPFVLSLRGRALSDAARLLAHRVNDCDAAADALHRLFPDQVRSYPGLADVAAAKIAALYKVASVELTQLRIERTNQSGRIGFLADALRGVTVALPATPTP